MWTVKGILQIILFNIVVSIVFTGGLDAMGIVLFTLLGIPLDFKKEGDE